jgi:hypothetical protein
VASGPVATDDSWREDGAGWPPAVDLDRVPRRAGPHQPSCLPLASHPEATRPVDQRAGLCRARPRYVGVCRLVRRRGRIARLVLAEPSLNFVTAVDDSSAETEAPRPRAKVPPVPHGRFRCSRHQRDFCSGEQFVVGVHRYLHPRCAAQVGRPSPGTGTILTPRLPIQSDTFRRKWRRLFGIGVDRDLRGHTPVAGCTGREP